MKFIDLFAGLGGFHLGLSQLGHTCVFASEIDSDLADLYEKNFGMRPFGDIRKHVGDVPAHDILCAGFPCQPFSKAGEQLGFDCPQWGDLFGYVVAILAKHKPKYLMIENVPNLLRHNGGETWKNILWRLRRQGYEIDYESLSPHFFGVPQIRERAFIVGARAGLNGFSWPEPTHLSKLVGIKSVLTYKPKKAKPLSSNFIRYIRAWQMLLDKLPADEQLPSFPIWAMEFGATYPVIPRALQGINWRRRRPRLWPAHPKLWRAGWRGLLRGWGPRPLTHHHRRRHFRLRQQHWLPGRFRHDFGARLGKSRLN